MKFILDTNICIYIIRQKPEQVLEKFKALVPGTVGISSITMSELMYGIYKSSKPDQNLNALMQFLIPLDIYPYDERAAMEYGKIRAVLEKSGNVIGSYDMLIGAHAKSLSYILVTNNVREFERIDGLQIENWI